MAISSRKLAATLMLAVLAIVLGFAAQAGASGPQMENTQVSTEVSAPDPIPSDYRVYAYVNGHWNLRATFGNYDQARQEANFLNSVNGWICRVTHNNQVVYSVG